MKKLKNWFGFLVAIAAIVLGGGNTYAMAEGVATNEDFGTAVTGPLDGPGIGVEGPNTLTKRQAIKEEEGNFNINIAQVNKKIVEMKLESCPIDQILRASNKVNKTNSVRVQYYSIGQRPVSSTLVEAVEATNNGQAVTLTPANVSAFDQMDVIMFPEIMGWKEDGQTRSTLVPLQVRVVSSDNSYNPVVIALNGQRTAQGNRWGIPALPVGTKMVRLGRAAGEKDVETGSYYQLPEKSEQYCQRFIMQAEQSIIERMSAKEVPWTFTRQERMAMDDMRAGIERSGLFGVKNIVNYGKSGNIWTTGGIYWEAGKDIELGHWEPKMTINENGEKVNVLDADDKKVYEYVIGEKELTRFVAAAIKDAGNASRTKFLFVDNLIYQAFTNLRSTRRVITESEKDYKNWGLDFESFTSMGTKIMIYRHDSFNRWCYDGRAFLLDERYLEKWVFGAWSRKTYDLKDLFIRNSNAVVMEEFSCWTLYYPNAHARVSRPAFDVADGVTDELEAA